MINNKYELNGVKDNRNIEFSAELLRNPLGINLICKNYNLQDVKIFGDNYFECLRLISDNLNSQGVILTCKGLQKNVYPSRLTMEMSSGIYAYTLKLGFQTTKTDKVNIFDRCDVNQISSKEEQIKSYNEWVNSL